jgi:hypothetical protein
LFLSLFISTLPPILAFQTYFYHVDLLGRLFLEDTVPKNIATSLKDLKFLNFFWTHLVRNTTGDHIAHPFVSFCGKERNFVMPADTAVVFHDLTADGKLVWAGSLQMEFDPSAVQASSIGRYRSSESLSATQVDNFVYILARIMFDLRLSHSQIVLSHSLTWVGPTALSPWFVLHQFIYYFIFGHSFVFPRNVFHQFLVKLTAIQLGAGVEESADAQQPLLQWNGKQYPIKTFEHGSQFKQSPAS